MKNFIGLLALVVLFATFAGYSYGANSQLDQVNKELQDIKRQKADAERKARETLWQLKRVRSDKVVAARDMKTLLNQIDKANVRIVHLNKQIKIVNSDLEESITKLEKAQIRVVERDQMLKSRMRLMYTNGAVSYLEVLLNATDFADFLDRYTQLTSIVDQDKELLAASKRDRDLVVQQKNRIERKLTELSNMYLEVEDLKDVLVVKEKEKEVLVASLSKQENRLEEISEEQEQAVVQLARKESELIRKKNKIVFQYKGGKLAWPVPDSERLTSQFGMRSDPFSGRRKMHKGIDIAAPAGTDIVAAEYGVVVVAQWTSGYGNTVVIDHGDDFHTWYAHIRSGGIKVKSGQTVKRGQKIAEVGSTGNSTGNHLHFEVRRDGDAINPIHFLQ